MQAIPVMDLKAGQVVHAKRGDRKNYQPVQSVLTHSSKPQTVLEAFLTQFKFSTIYIADLDAIQATGSHLNWVTQMAKRYSDIEFWLDDGRQWQQRAVFGVENIKPVLGTESQQTLPAFASDDFILSLDFCGDKALGLPEWFCHGDYWPTRIIVMNLALVGAASGADLSRLATLRQTHPKQSFVAAGGVRGLDDLRTLQRLGIKQALLASALHSGALTATDLAALNPVHPETNSF